MAYEPVQYNRTLTHFFKIAYISIAYRIAMYNSFTLELF